MCVSLRNSENEPSQFSHSAFWQVSQKKAGVGDQAELYVAGGRSHAPCVQYGLTPFGSYEQQEAYPVLGTEMV